ncbi:MULTISPECIES: phage baseplate assembly protein [Burkholderia]|uniref:phage baseplate assembly protein n=1 Tax=Burkholderia TaxID=32008 RepID=UPI0005505BE3|nr:MULTISPECIES: tail protein [Burkholderia]AOJ13147.1 phage tail protein [Burkholderia vietnamiensis]MCA8194096.1 phage tail protein [Burkholderia vietnamiensis]TCT31957.1 prophage tail gpP-like protein [Burkholderia vietnamiensis]SCZ28146.1 Mu-like prophage tail protein gpP [Burkholderia vietnamiensis]SFX62989.1 Mu-like prophage tail protein gpP [Burkholderia vietnamiensis]
MPTASNTAASADQDKVSLLIGGRAHREWTSYEIDSHLITPGDAWRVELSPPDGSKIEGTLPDAVTEGAPIEVRIGRDTVLVGRIDTIDEDTAKDRNTLTLSGRDGAGILLDCGAPIFVAKQATLEQVIANVVRPLGITKVKISAGKTYTSEKINIEPGDRAWNVLSHAAEANGLWPWFAPDGTLIVGGPDYTTKPVATLIMRRSGKGNNVMSLKRSRSMAERYSEVTVLGQTHGTAHENGKNGIKGVAKDPAVTFYRPHVVVDHECESVAMAISRARKLLMDSRLHGYTLTARVLGHRTSDGVLWTPGQRIHVVSEPHNINAVFFLIGRRFSKARSGGSTTTLTLKEDGVWTLDAHAHKRKHRRGKNKGPEEIIDVGQG